MPIHEKSLIKPENLLTHESLEIDGVDVPMGTLDVALYRDDIGLRPVMPWTPS